MQDRFKFRIFDKINKVMRYNDFILTSNGYTGELLDLNTSEDENTLFIMRSLDTYKRYSEPMQCTGLKDKNSKLIYEGDIVDILSEIDTTAIIKWSEDLARFVIVFENIQADFDNYNSNELEVIGDIYND